jgi:1-deoxy-D-xylulose-5-phosphate synthase
MQATAIRASEMLPDGYGRQSESAMTVGEIGADIDLSFDVLSLVRQPEDLRELSAAALSQWCREVRGFLVRAVSARGGHLGSNLGVVELTAAIHRVFESPQDAILWDTGHQAYVHKLITGRMQEFAGLRARSGLSGYPSRAESVHDVYENSHASVGVSYGHGIARARAMSGCEGRSTVVVIGDGGLTGGVVWEALSNLGASSDPVIVIVNDNGRSYAPTTGGIADHLRQLRHGPQPGGGHGPTSMFAALGLDYIGPVDGHDIPAMEAAFGAARDRHRPVVVHCVTRKGRGYAPAETNEVDHMHAASAFDPGTGLALRAGGRTWTQESNACLLELAQRDPRIVAITAAMLDPVGLTEFSVRLPGQVLDVGIAEQHAVAMAAGLAIGGQHPVVCLYAPFVNRAFDQVLADVALHELPVTFLIDRAGVTGEDGPSHHGLWDVAVLSAIPGMRIAAPRDGVRLRELVTEAVQADGPTAVRYPKGELPAPIPAVRSAGPVDIVRAGTPGGVLVVAAGPMVSAAMEAAGRLVADGLSVTVADPGWVCPVPDELVALAAGYRLVVTVEDGSREGGFGSALSDALSDAGLLIPVRRMGLPRQFLEHGNRRELLAAHQLDATGIAATVHEAATGSAAAGMAA